MAFHYSFVSGMNQAQMASRHHVGANLLAADESLEVAGRDSALGNKRIPGGVESQEIDGGKSLLRFVTGTSVTRG